MDKNGKKRELHSDKAVQVMNMKVAPAVSQKPRMVKYCFCRQDGAGVLLLEMQS